MAWRSAVKLVLLGLVVALLSGCGHGPDHVCATSSQGSPEPNNGGPAACPAIPGPISPSPSMVHTSPAGAPGLISLKIRRVDQPGAAPVDLNLHCQDGKSMPDSNVPDPTAACALLISHPEELDPVPRKGVMCSQLYGGPEKATITGTLNGKPVDLELSRTDGCKTAQWRALAPLLGNPAGGV